MVYRNDNIQTVQAQCVYEKDVFEYELGLEPKLVHKPAIKTGRTDSLCMHFGRQRMADMASK